MQKDLFGTSAALADSTPKSDFLQNFRISLRLDQALIVMIILLVAYVLIFSFGVETGKRYSVAEIRAERTKRERMVEELTGKIFEAQAAKQNPAAAAAPAVPAPTVDAAAPGTAAVPAPAAATPAEGKPGGKYTIQVVTVTSKSAAEREIKKFTSKGHRGFVIPSGKYLQICVNGFESRDQASQMMKQLKTNGMVPKDSYVRPIV
jgi:cell division septation protein DedD